ncbi:MAG: thymidylate kinase [Oscillibacter sp.]|nr:thymidylate kinase [Oscillibacter sp.]
MGRLLVLEGLDGSGKATQSDLLAQALQARGTPVRRVSFPDYGSDSSALVRMYLSGAFGTRPGDVNAYAASSFYAVDRYASYRRDWGAFYHEGGTVIADRYSTSNAVHQCSKLPRERWDAFLDWLFSYEYDLLGLPAPDAVLYLRLDPAVSLRWLKERGAADDIHERDREYQARSREAADYCAGRLRWSVIECVRAGQPRSVQDIHGEVLRRATEALSC